MANITITPRSSLLQRNSTSTSLSGTVEDVIPPAWTGPAAEPPLPDMITPRSTLLQRPASQTASPVGDPEGGPTTLPTASGGTTTVTTPSTTGGTVGPVVATPTSPQVNPDQTTTPPSIPISDPEGGPTTIPNGGISDPEGGPTTIPIPQVANATPLNGSDTVSILNQLSGAIQPNSLNALNDYYQPTYHFRLFAAPDSDLATQAGNDLSKVSGRQTKQVTIAESGVTGWNIHEVEIDTISAGNASTREMPATLMKITVTEPLGLSFLDGMLGATTLLGNQNVSKATYYLELTFTGYNTDGTYAGRPMKALGQFSNGGTWIWSLAITNIETKLNEGSAVYKLDATVLSSQPLVTKPGQSDTNNFYKTQSSITCTGATVREMYKSYVDQLNSHLKDSYGGNNKAQRIKYNQIVTKKIVVGPPNAVGKDPGDFKLKPQAPDKSAVRTCNFDNANGNITCTVSAGTTISDFMTSVIKNTEEGQALAKDEPSTSGIDSSTTQTNSRGFKECVIFMTEADVKTTDYDKTSGNYIKEITMYLTPYVTQRPIISPVQAANAQSPQNQAAMIGSLIKNGFVKKRYDYIFTGKNTEVLDIDLSWSMAWEATLPRLEGARMGMANEAMHGRTHELSYNVTPQTTRKAAAADLTVVPDTPTTPVDSQSTTTPGVTGGDAIFTNAFPLSASSLNSNLLNSLPSSFAPPSLTSLGPNASTISTGVAASLSNTTNSTLAGMGSQVTALNASTTPLVSSVLAKVGSPSGPTSQITPSNGNNIYVEDLISSANNGNQPTTNPAIKIPVSFWNSNTETETGAGLSDGQYHRGKSVAGAVFEQINGTPLNNDGKFQSLEMTIRGDPFWLGQTDIERQITLRSGKPSYDPKALPDYVSGNQVIYVYFRYPLQIGDNFVPILNDCATFNGLYEVTNVKHLFADGFFKQTLRCIKYTLHNMTAATTGQPGTGSGNGSSPSIGQNTTTPGTGTTPGTTTTGPSLAPTDNGIGQISPTSLQSSDTTAVGNLSPDQTAALKAAVGKNESGNNPGQGNNGLGFIGQYQFGRDALVDQGYVVRGSGSTSQPSTWQWTGQNGVNSVNDFISNPNEQNSAMNGLLQQNYNTLTTKGAITSDTPPQQVAGLLAASHLSGAGGASSFAKGNGNPSDAFGSSTQHYYNIGFNSFK